MAEKKVPGVYRRNVRGKESAVYYVRFTFQGRPYRWSSGETTKARAEAYLADIKRSIRDGNFEEKHLHQSPATLRLSGAVSWYLENYVRIHTVEEKNRRDSERILRAFLEVVGDKPVIDVTRADVERYKTDRIASGNKPDSINRHLGTISGMFSRLARKDIIGKNPLEGKIDYFPEGQPRDRYASPEEMRLILGSIQNPEFKMIVKIAVSTGMRLSNITELQVSNIDRERQCFVFVMGKLKPGATPRVNVVPIAKQVFPKLMAFIAERGITEGRVFTFESQTITNLWIAKMKELGIQGLRFHDLRRTYATNLLSKSGADTFDVSKILGHTTPDITSAVYAMTEVERKRRFIDQSFEGIDYLDE